jgi:multisubunit Na+/H+ antiporter MnhE subunit
LWSIVAKVRQFGAFIGLGLPAFYVCWIIFVGSFSLHELLVGIIGAALAAIGLLVIDLRYPARFSPTIGELFSLWRMPWYLVSGTWEILKVSLKDLLGIEAAKSLFRVVPFDAGTKDDRRAVARRVLAVTYTTVAPNFIVLGINVNSQMMLFHQIERSSPSKMTKYLGARA